MKKLTIYLFCLGLTLTLACGDDEPATATAQELAFEKLAGNWTFGSSGGLFLDGQDVSLNFPGFGLSFADGTYQIQNGGDLFNANGTWRWADETAASLLLDTGEEVTISELTESIFRFSFTHTGTGGEAAGIAGAYTVSLEK